MKKLFSLFVVALVSVSMFANQKLYLQLSSDWAGWPAKYAIYAFNNDENDWSDWLSPVENEENVLVGEIKDGFEKVIFVRFNGDATEIKWDEENANPKMVWSQTVDLSIPEGKDLFAVKTGGTGGACDGIWGKHGEALPNMLADGYYLVGNFDGVDKWGVSALTSAEMLLPSTGEGAREGELFIEAIDLKVGDELKIAYVENDGIADDKWFGTGDGNNNFVITDEYAGTKNIYFNPTKQDDWNGYIWIDKNDETAIDNTLVSEKAVKFFENGQLVIIKNGVKYNALGEMLR